MEEEVPKWLRVYSVEILVTVIKDPGLQHWMQPKKSIKSEALCYKRLSHLDAETQASQAVAPHRCSPVAGCVSAADCWQQTTC